MFINQYLYNRKTNIYKKKVIFIVVGRLNASLTTSKVLPIIATNLFSSIYVFRERAGDPIKGVTYITSNIPRFIKPAFLRRILQRIYEPIQLIYYSFKYKPIIINGYQIFPKGINSYIAARLTNTKCIISSIGGLPEIETYYQHKFLWRNLFLFFFRHADIVTTKGKTVTNYLIEHGVSSNKIFTYNGAINTDRFNISYNFKRDIDLIFVGSLIKHKGPDIFVQIVKRVQKTFPNVIAKILGAGELETHIRNMIKVLNLSLNIEMLGYVKYPENYYKRATIIVMPTKSEGLSTAMLEAMACGCIPVVSDIGCLTEAAINNYTAIVIDDYQDVESFSYHIIELLNNELKRYSLVNNAANLVSNKYNINTQSAIYKMIYDILIH